MYFELKNSHIIWILSKHFHNENAIPVILKLGKLHKIKISLSKCPYVTISKNLVDFLPFL